VIQQALNGMIAIMLAKFMLNDVPHYLFSESTHRPIRIVQPGPPRSTSPLGGVVTTPTGTCYPDAWRYAMQHSEAILAHGTAISLGRRIGHAWVELPDGTVWEPSSQAVMPIEKFYGLVDPIVEDRYTSEEAAIMVARVGKHGPWSAEERMEYIGR